MFLTKIKPIPLLGFYAILLLHSAEQVNTQPVQKNFLRKYIPRHIDVSKLKTVEKLPSKDEEYLSALNDEKILAVRFRWSQEIYCTYKGKGRELILDDKYFDILKNLYITNFKK
jgi:hypothetical protein